MKDQACKDHAVNGPERNAKEPGCFTSKWCDTRDYLESCCNVQVKNEEALNLDLWQRRGKEHRTSVELEDWVLGWTDMMTPGIPVYLNMWIVMPFIESKQENIKRFKEGR